MNEVIVILLSIMIVVNIGTLICMGLLISLLQNFFDSEKEGSYYDE